MAKPTNILGDYFTLRDVYSRAESLCNQVEANKVTKSSLIAMMKRQLLKVVTFGDGAFAKHYLTPLNLSIASGKIVIDHANAPGIRSIRAMSVPIANLGAMVDGDLGVYTLSDDWEFFIRARHNSEHDKYGRLAYITEGDRSIFVFHGSLITAAMDSVTLIYVRTPYIGFTEADIDASDGATKEYLDCKDYIVPFVETGSAVEALKQAGVRDLKTLPDEQAQVIANLNAMIKDDERAREVQGKDSLTR